ncbi:MAG TPA: hypothetical protein VLL52_25640, partial [Anaerolineae bacterium]|nr:hypothetical protein [Anaerolineae bacterium]
MRPTDANEARRLAARYGLYGAGALILVCLIGMVEEFNNRYIIRDVLTVGYTFIGLIVVFMGYYMAKQVDVAYNPAHLQDKVSVRPYALQAGGISGLV